MQYLQELTLKKVQQEDVLTLISGVVADVSYYRIFFHDNSKILDMEKQNVLHSEITGTGKRTYFFDLKVAENGTHYLMITESREKEDGEGHHRNSIIIFENGLRRFSHAFLDVVLQMDGERLKRKLNEEQIAEIRKEYPSAFEPWSKEDDEDLVELFANGQSVDTLAEHFQRKPSAITYRLKKLEAA